MGVRPKKVKIVVPEVIKSEEVRIAVTPPDPTEPDPKGVITTKRAAPIHKNSVNTSKMTTQSDRFRES